MRNLGILSVVLLLLWGCATTEGGSPKSGNYRYDYERHAMHPDFGAYHFSDDSSAFYVGIDCRDVLFTKKDDASRFQARLRLDLRITGLDTAYSDSLSIPFLLPYEENMPPWKTLEARFSLPSNYRYRAYAVIRDLERNKVHKGSVNLNKHNTSNHQNYLIRKSEGEVILGNQLPEGTTIELTCDRCEEDELQLLQKLEQSAFPPPPYSVSNFSPMRFSKADLMLRLFYPESRSMSLDLLEGTYVFTGGDRWDQGRVIHTTSALYPEITSVAEMAATLRYITSRSEYESLSREYNQRKSVEDFWLKSGGSQEKARDLIRIYYGRVREANTYFSEAAPGWKTDRGLIHIVFGNAKKIVVSDRVETWIYGEEDNLNALVFRFFREDNGQTDNRFVLERNELVKTRWERAITSWRNGRIYAD